MFRMHSKRDPTITYLPGTFASWGRGGGNHQRMHDVTGLLHHSLHISQLNRNLVFKEPRRTASVSADTQCPLPAGLTERCGPWKAANGLCCLQTDFLQHGAKMYTISCHQDPVDCRESIVSAQKTELSLFSRSPLWSHGQHAALSTYSM